MKNQPKEERRLLNPLPLPPPPPLLYGGDVAVTFRDDVAVIAMKEIMRGAEGYSVSSYEADELADMCYYIADAMMERRREGAE